MTATRTAFNTGAQYTAQGQRITAEIVGDVCVFVDHDRGIDGQFPIFNAHGFEASSDLARLVIRAYDYHQYKGVDYFGDPYIAKKQMQYLGYDLWMEKHGLQPVPRVFQR